MKWLDLNGIWSFAFQEKKVIFNAVRNRIAAGTFTKMFLTM